jgi:type IV secretion system protein VirB3
MFMGVPMVAFGANVVATVIFCIVIMGSMKFCLIGIAFHYICRAIVFRDHNMFGVMAAWVQTGGVQVNRRFWGGSSLSPVRLKPSYSPADVTDV